MLHVSDLLRISARQIVRQRARYLGVMLAVMLGTCGLIVVVTMGRDVKRNINRDLDLLGGATLIKVSFRKYEPFEEHIAFRQETVEAVRDLPGVAGVSVLALKTDLALTTMGRERHWFPLVGIDRDYWDVNSFSAVAGDLFGVSAHDAHARVCVLGSELVRKVFGDRDAVGAHVQIDREIYTVTGVLDGPGVGDRNQWAFIPLATARDRITGLKPANRLFVRCHTWDDVASVAAALPERITSVQAIEHLQVDVGWERLKHVRRVVWWVELFIYISIAATLGLGGCGIWYVMMGTVKARTREIGLKKAIGAEDGDILAQFLTEALCLSLASALVGVVLARLVSGLISALLGSPVPTDLFILSLGLSLVFSVALGLGAGFMPSRWASRLEVVQAVRYE